MNLTEFWGIILLVICSTVYAAKVESSVEQEKTSIDLTASLNILKNLSVSLEECIVDHELDVCETIFSTALEKSLILTMELNPLASQEVHAFLESHSIVRWYCYLKGHQDPTHFFSTLCTDFSIQDVERVFDMPPRINRLRVSMLIHLLDHSDNILYSVAKKKAAPILDDLIMDTLQTTAIRTDKHKPIKWKETGLCFAGVRYFAREFPLDLARVLSFMASSSPHQSFFIVKYGSLLSHLFLPYSDGQALKNAEKSITSFDIDYLFALDFYLQIAEISGRGSIGYSLQLEYMTEIANRVLSSVSSPLHKEPKATIYNLLECHMPNVCLLMKHRFKVSRSSDGQKQPIPWKIQKLVERVYANAHNHFAPLLLPRIDLDRDSNVLSIDNKRIMVSYPVFAAYQICLTLLRGHQCARILASPLRSALELIQVASSIGELVAVFPGVRWALMTDLKDLSEGYDLRFTPHSLRMALQGYQQGLDDRWMYSLISGVKGVIAKKPYLSSLFLDIAPRLLPKVLTHEEMQACTNRDWRSCGAFCNLLNLTLKVAPHMFTDEDAKLNASDDLLQQIRILDKILNTALWTKLGEIEITGDWLLALEVYLYRCNLHVSDPKHQSIVIKMGELIRTICFAEGHRNRLAKKEVLIAKYLLKYRVPRVAEVYFQYRQGVGNRARLISEVDFLSLYHDAGSSEISLQSMDPITWALVIHGYALDNLGLIPLKEKLPMTLQIMYALLSEFRRFPERFSGINTNKLCRHQSHLNGASVTRVIWSVPDLSGLESLSIEEYRVIRDALIDVFLHVAFKLPLYSTNFAHSRLEEEEYLTYKEYASFATFTLDRYCFTHHKSPSVYEVVPLPSQIQSQSQSCHEREENSDFFICNNVGTS